MKDKNKGIKIHIILFVMLKMKINLFVLLDVNLDQKILKKRILHAIDVFSKWSADPKNQIVYVFLSNRIYPDASNEKLLDMDVRTNIMKVIYDSLNEK